jgi:tetratricopeptide (TPR) repeat protein
VRLTLVALLSLLLLGGARAAGAAGADATFIETAAKAADAAQDPDHQGRAISLWRGVVAIKGDGDPAAKGLHRALVVAGFFKRAKEVVERYAAATADAKEKQWAQEEALSLDSREAGYGATAKIVPATKQARLAFARGQKAFKAKRYEEAIAYFKAGAVMDPEVTGNFRELAASFEKLGRTAEAAAFYSQYMYLRPFGETAPFVVQRLTALKHIGTVDISTSFPCARWVINGDEAPSKVSLPRRLSLPPGSYRILCYNETYRFASYSDFTVAAGGNVVASIDWALVVNRLDPGLRWKIEHPTDGTMRDLGTDAEIGVPVPSDRRALKVVIYSPSDPRTQKEMFLKLEPGKRVEVKW